MLGLLYGLQSGEFASRLADITKGDTHQQLSLALRSIDVSGWFHLGAPTLGRAVAEGDTDYATATLAAVIGAGPALLAVGIVVSSGVALIRSAQRVPAPQMPTLTGSGWALIVPTVWIVAGNLGLVPFSGLPAPLIAGGGSAALTVGMLLGACSAASVGLEDWELHPMPGQRFLSASLAACFLVVAVAQTGHLMLTQNRLRNEWLYRTPGRLLAADGTVLSATGTGGTRHYTDIVALSSLGRFQRKNRASGIELVNAGALTCGNHHGRLARTLSLGLLDECGPADVVTTIDSELQKVVYAQAQAHAGATIAVVDLDSGGILAAATYNGDFVDIVKDSTLPPGSTFKLVTATASAESGLNPPPLGASLDLSGERLGNDWDGPCPYPGGIVEAIANSCNTTFGWVAATLGSDLLMKAATDVGFLGGAIQGPADPSRNSEPIEIGLDTATTGLSPGNAHTSGQMARTGIGQESVRATVLDMARVFDNVWTGQRRQLTLTAGICRDDRMVPWSTRSQPIGVGLDQVREGLELAARTGSLNRLSGLVEAGKTGTAQTQLDGQPALASWLVALSGDRVLAIRVAPTPQNRRPKTGHGGAVDIAHELLTSLPTRQGEPQMDPCQRV